MDIDSLGSFVRGGRKFEGFIFITQSLSWVPHGLGVGFELMSSGAQLCRWEMGAAY
jgi:hypothetical protein